MKRLGWLIAGLWPLTVCAQAPAPNSGPAPDTLASIQAEATLAQEAFETAFKNLGRALDEKRFTPKDASEFRAADKAYHNRKLSLLDQALALARLHPEKPEGIAAPVWVVREMLSGRGGDFADRGDIAFQLLSKAPSLDAPDILSAMVYPHESGAKYPELEPFLRAVLNRSQNRTLVAYARYFLGLQLAELARDQDKLESPISGPELKETLGKSRLDRLRARDASKLRSEAETLLKEVVRKDNDLGLRLDDSARWKLYRIRHLRIGQPAPELVGEDIDGAPIRLSDYRGKFVVLWFWETVSDSSMSRIDQYKDLVAKMKGRPFTLVGVNEDAAEKRDKVKEVVKKEGITWRSFWAGGRDGDLLRPWGFPSCPTSYTIDAKGIILDEHIGEEFTPEVFQSLVQAATEATR